MKVSKPIMLIEDDEIDVMTIKRALREINVTNRLIIAGDGLEALELLRAAKDPKPCIILLDLNMPRMNGLEFLQVIKSEEALRRIPVIVLTSSQEEQDRYESYTLGIAGYMVKPVGYPQFVDVIRTIDMYWTLSELPPL